MSNKKSVSGNDQVIADFFKKSLVVIIVLGVIVLLAVFVFNQKPEKKQITEQTFQAPTQLSKKNAPPSVKFEEQSDIRGIRPPTLFSPLWLCPEV